MTTMPKQLARVDMERVAFVHRMSFDERLPWLAGLHTPDEDRAYFRDIVFERCRLWGCLEDAQLLGFIAFREAHIEQLAHVEQLYVLPAHQGRGLGMALLSVAQERCRELDLWTFQRNEAARRFYERRGFVAVETTDGAGNDEKEPDVRYRWRAR